MRIVNISHDLCQQHVNEGSFNIKNPSFKIFPILNFKTNADG
jgi:S-adenosylmethionine hydrolase